jgi:Gpi18-like mannosyltransferase
MKSSASNIQTRTRAAWQYILNHDWLFVLCALLASRLVIHLIGLIGMDFSFQDPKGKGLWYYLIRPSEVWIRWDVDWYRRIAVWGYEHKPYTGQAFATWGFMPLYPMIVGAVLSVLHITSTNGFFYVATVFSNLCTFAALLWLYKIAKTRLAEPKLLILFMLVACGSFILAIPYTESLFLLLAVAVWSFSQQRKLVLAAILAGLAVVTRIQGVALFAFPLTTLWLLPHIPLPRKLMKTLLLGVLFAIPLFCLAMYMQYLTGNPLAFIDIQSAWKNSSPYPLKAFVGLLSYHDRIDSYLHLFMWLPYLLIFFRNFKKIDLPTKLYCLGVFLVSTSTEVFYGTYRYVIALFPVLMVLTQEKKWVQNVFVYVNLLFTPIFIIGFVLWRNFII